MNYNPIIIVAGEPNSIFIEIFLKSIKKNKFKSQIILIASLNLLRLQMKKLNYNFDINILNLNNYKKTNLSKKKINLFDVKYETKKAFNKTTKKSKSYISNSFELALKLLKLNISKKLINGPISKKHFLEGKYPGVTEYLSRKTNTKKYAMLIYNKKLSVCPITTHMPLKLVSKKISKKQ